MCTAAACVAPGPASGRVRAVQKMQAGRLVLCEAELESIDGRKMWMTARVQDRPGGKVYASSRALFVVPRTTSLVRQSVRYVMHTLLPRTVSVE